MRVTISLAIALAASGVFGCTNLSAPDDTPATPPPGPGTGAVEVEVSVAGSPEPSVSHAVVIAMQVRTVPFAGGTVLVSDLPPGTQSVRLASPAPCWITTQNPAVIAIESGKTSRVEFTVFCAGPPEVVFYRTSPHSDGHAAAHGTLAERYVIEPDGSFRLQFKSTRAGFFEYSGTTTRDTLYHFSFSANGGAWTASGSERANCLAVAYNRDMVLSDFEDGSYCSDAAHQADSAWVSLEPLPEARWQLAATSWSGVVYVAGGVADHGAGWVAPAEIVAYDPARNSWGVAGTLKDPVRAPAMAAVGDRIYIVGGCRDNPWEPLATLQIFDPATGTIQAGPPMSHGRCGLAVAVLDGRLHAIGGVFQWDPSDPWASAWDDAHEVFDPATGAWSTLAPLPRARGGHGAVVLGGKIYVAGGLGDTLQVYDPATDTWSKAGSPRARFAGAAAAVGGSAYFIGGGEYQTLCCGGPVPSAAVERFDPVSGRWEYAANMPTARTGVAAAVVDGAIYVVGGSSSGGASEALAVLERFRPR